jgi:hypothetical protein
LNAEVIHIFDEVDHLGTSAAAMTLVAQIFMRQQIGNSAEVVRNMSLQQIV